MHGKLWWGNGKSPQQGFNTEIRPFRISEGHILQRNDLRVMSLLAGKRMELYGYETDESVSKLTKISKKFKFLLPTYSEWCMFKLLIDPAHWIRCMRIVMKDPADPLLKGYNFYRKRKLDKIDEKILFYFLRTMKFIIMRSNLIAFFCIYFQRIVFCMNFYRAAKLEQNLPQLLTKPGSDKINS